ncbi:unnamed protein product [Clonostachys rosea]|uniref:F-box domain-containing protein n=1 Tax=Bionectria ochroleuca TaxID=29856 RepID=A0ABY6V0Y5_BIOOC|nr:unnamed protein product [Clonostachys rosea]
MSNRPGILRLPDNISLTILDLVATPPPPKEDSQNPALPSFKDPFPAQIHDPKSLSSIKLTCEIFYSLATPLTFRSVTIRPGASRNLTEHLRKLRSILYTNPTLGVHWRYLRINLSKIWLTLPEERGEIADLLEHLLPFFSYLSMLSLTVHTHQGLTARLLRQASYCLPHIEEIELCTWGYFTDIATLSTDMYLPNLESLRILCLPDAEESSLDLSVPYPVRKLSKLRMSVGRSSFTAFERIVQRPENLSSLRLDYYPDLDKSLTISLTYVISVIQTHAATLRDLTLYGPFRCSADITLNLSRFTALETLTVSRRLLGDLSQFGLNDARNFVPPRLKKFTMDIVPFLEYSSANYEHGAIRAEPGLELGFGQAEEYWVRDLAQFALNYSTGLSEITITHSQCFEREPWFDLFRRQTTEPWGHLKALKGDLRPHGITVIYNELDSHELLENFVPDGIISDVDFNSHGLISEDFVPHGPISENFIPHGLTSEEEIDVRASEVKQEPNPSEELSSEFPSDDIVPDGFSSEEEVDIRASRVKQEPIPSEELSSEFPSDDIVPDGFSSEEEFDIRASRVKQEPIPSEELFPEFTLEDLIPDGDLISGEEE